MTTKIIKCAKCKSHKFQDVTYGYKMRVYNSTRKDNKIGWRCTVCLNQIEGVKGEQHH